MFIIISINTDFYFFISYKEAHYVQQEIIKLTEKEYQQHHDNKLRKIKEEVSVLEKAQLKETEILSHKYILKYSELKVERAINFDKLLQKFKNKQNNTDFSQKIQLNYFEKTCKNQKIKDRDLKIGKIIALIFLFIF